MLKKIVALVLSLCAIFALTVSAAASTDEAKHMSIEKIIENDISFGDDITNKGTSDFLSINPQSDVMKSDIKQVEEDFIDSFGKDENATSNYAGLEFLPDTSYKVYTLNNEDIISTYQSTQNIGDIISENYLVKMPINNSKHHMIGMGTFYLIDGKWKLGSYGKMPEKQTVLTDTKKIAKQLEKVSTGKLKSLTDGDSIQKLRVIVLNKYDTYAIYIKATSGEYVIPISTNKLYTELKENKIYSANDFIKTLSLNSQENANDQKASEDMYGGGASIDANNNSAANVIGVVLGVLGIIALSIFIKKYKLFSNQE